MAASPNFRIKLIAGALAPLVVAAALQALYSVVSQRREALAGLEAKANALTSLLVNVAGPSIATDDPDGVDEGLAYIERDPDFEFAIAVAPGGKLLGYRGPADARELRRTITLPTRAPVVTRSGDTLIASYPVVTSGKTLGQLAVGLRTTNAEAQAARLAMWVAAISLVGIAAAVAVVLGLTGRITRRNREMTELLDSMDQGFLSMHRDGTLVAERSALAARLLGPYQPGQRLWEAIAAHDPTAGRWLELCWASVLEDTLPLELTLHQLPSKLAIGDHSYRIEYKPRIEDGAVTDTLIVITDTTAERARERAEAAERDLLRVVERMTRDPRGFGEFVEETRQLIRRIQDDPGTTAGDAVKREIHTLKGNAAIFGMSQISEKCHELEDAIASTGAPSPVLVREIAQMWSELTGKIERVMGGDKATAIDVRPEDLGELRAAITRGAPVAMLENIVRSWTLERTRPRLERFAEQASGLAGRLGKGELAVQVDDHGVRLDPDRFKPFWSVMSHAVRNAVDHGIEPPSERVTAGKPEHGRIELVTRCEGGSVVIEIGDDGRGIDWDLVRRTAQHAARPHTTRTDLIKAILSDGITTRSEVSDTSGRGIGLAAVREACERLGGKIEIDSELGRGTRFRFKFDLEHRERMTSRIPRDLVTELSRL